VLIVVNGIVLRVHCLSSWIETRSERGRIPTKFI
jgi:hypothetical protein